MTVFFSRGLWACVLFLISLSFAYRVHAAPELNAQALIKAPQVDGDVLNDEAWLDAQAATGFVQVRPFEGRSASQRTEVFVGYTEDTLYIGVMCYDEEPSGLIISDSRRDSRLSSVDSFKVIIDSFLDRQMALFSAPRPVQWSTTAKW